MKKNFLYLQKLSLLAISVFFLACENPNTIGYTIGGTGLGTASFTDTLNIDMATVLADSNVTSNGNYVMAGINIDPIFGKTTTVAYMQPSLSMILNSTATAGVINPLVVKDNPIPDSLVLRLVNTGLFFGDSTSKNTFNIYRLKSSISNTRNYNGSENLPYETTPITSFTISGASFKNATYDTLKSFLVYLPKSIVTEILNVSIASGADNSLFNAAFPGFAIVPTSSSKTIFTFNTGAGSYGTPSSTASWLIPYWHYSGDTTSTVYSFDFNGPRFSNVATDRSGTSLSNLTKTNNSLGSKLTNDKLFVQSGSGIAAKLDFSKIKNLGNNIQINKAFLTLNLTTGSTSTANPSIFNFVLGQLDLQNQQVRTSDNLLNYITFSSRGPAGSVYSLDTTNTVNIDVTNYLQKLLNNKETIYQLGLFPSRATGTISNDNLRRSEFDKPKLSIYYTKY